MKKSKQETNIDPCHFYISKLLNGKQGLQDTNYITVHFKDFYSYPKI